jgi:hypothetical protein
LHAHGRGARTDACGRSFAVFSTQVFKSWLAPSARSAACGRVFAVLSAKASAVSLRIARRVAACLK